MKVWELRAKMYILKTITKEKAQSEICKVIDKTLLRDNEFSKFHEENKYKYYSFNSFHPIENTGIYRQGNIYTVILRTVDGKLADYFYINLANEYTEGIKVLTIEKRVLHKKHIDKIYSITPAVVKYEEGYWKTKHGIEFFEKRLKENLVKKYNQFYNTKLDEDFEFINHMEFTNQKPIAVKYKNISILGDKVSLQISENSSAQKLAFFAIGTGLLEMGSRGCGFVGYRWL